MTQDLDPCNNAPLNDLPPAPQPVPEYLSADSELPDALRAFREWVLKLSSTGDLTVAVAESFLKTLNMCLEKGLLRCGPEIDASELVAILVCCVYIYSNYNPRA